MTAFLNDEMLPPATARLLRDEHGHDAVHVGEVGLAATEDVVVAQLAREQGRVLVTENVADFAHETDVVLIFVLKRTLPAGAAMATTFFVSSRKNGTSTRLITVPLESMPSTRSA